MNVIEQGIALNEQYIYNIEHGIAKKVSFAEMTVDEWLKHIESLLTE